MSLIINPNAPPPQPIEKRITLKTKSGEMVSLDITLEDENGRQSAAEYIHHLFQSIRQKLGEVVIATVNETADANDVAENKRRIIYIAAFHDAMFGTFNRVTKLPESERAEFVEIFRIGDRITVLRDGQRVLTSPLVDLTAGDVVHAIVGRKVEGAFEWKPRSVDRSGEPLLEVRHLNVGTRVRDVSFTAHRGEIIGLAGLMGAGRTELARALFGIDHIDSGDVLIGGQRVHLTNSGKAIAAGVALIPEDRREQGLVLEHSVRDNLLLPLLGRFRRGPLLNDRKGSAIAAELINELSVKTASPELTVGRLSGGNQQKVVIGKWLGTDPDILIMDEPTAGVDIGTKTEIVERIRALADLGKVVIVISSELPELLAVADRVLVLRAGAIDRTIERADIADEHALQLAIQGVAA